MLSSLKRSPLVELAVTELRDQLGAGTWAIGAQLPAETRLAEQLGVGRSTVREAISALVHAGLLESRQGAGTFVVALTEADGWESRLRRARLLDVYDVRAALEVRAARLAAERRTPSDLRALRRTWRLRQQRLRAGRDAAFVAADLEFHAAVVTATHNPLLEEMFTSFRRVLSTGLVEIVSDPALSSVDNTGAHGALLAAIEAGDPGAAAAATEQLLAGTAAAITDL